MKKTIRRILSGVLAAALSLTVFALPAAAADEEVGITFPEYKEIRFDEDDTAGLFPAFQDLYPGDVREQEISLRNTSGSSVEVSLRVLSSVQAAEKEELIRDLLYGVEADGEHVDLLHAAIYNGSSLIYEGTVGGPVDQGIPLGTLRDGYGAQLRVELTVNGEHVDNDYQNLLGYIDWELTASWDRDPYIPGPDPDPDPSDPDEEISEPSVPTTSVPESSVPGGPSSPGEEEIDDGETPLAPFPEQDPLPQTGDNFPLYLAIGGVILCAAVVVIVLATGKKHRHVK